ncbi:GGDEF domain-containing protein [Parafrankia discariae]|uniref:GGDEF domain-containing protein n=1 Tax=Parafrankia discariae TaxID=365528 RepID=UPI0005584BCB|nr:GGDEF domain-containing protein [Parafrankia discariae]
MTAARFTARLSNRGWAWYLAGGLTVAVAVGPLPTTGRTSALRLTLYLLVSGSAVVAVAVSRRAHAPAGGLPWRLFAAAQATSVLGDAMLTGSRGPGADGFPGLWDACHLARYPLLMAGLMILARRRGRPGGIAGLLDSLMMVVAGALVSWVYLVAPRLALDQPPLVSLASVAYPVGDLALFAASLRLFFDGGRRPPAFYLLAAHLAILLAADARYVPRQLEGDYRVGGELDVLWLAAALFLGAAALHPSRSRLDAGGARPGPVLSVPRLLALTAAALVAPVVLAVQCVRGETSGLVVVAVASAAMFILIILRMAGLVADQHRAAITDVLTGLHTRRHLEGELSVAVDRALRDGTRLGLFLVDVDHFKAINDGYGHLVGDAVLVEVAHRLQAATRPGDVLGRYGGEEFAVLVTNLRETDLAVVGERLRRQVGGTPIRIGARPAAGHPAPADGDRPAGALSAGGGKAGDGTVPGGAADEPGTRASQVIAVTVSVGAAAVPTHAADPFNLFGAADAALYAAKSAGRDRVAVSGRALPPAGGDDQLAVSGTAEAL